MSLELPEAHILAEQMNRELCGKIVKSYVLRDHENLQRLGFINKNTGNFDRLTNEKVESVISRGSVIRIKLTNGMNLILSPEYGGVLTYHAVQEVIPIKFHLKLDFSDDTSLTVRLTGMGVIQAMNDDELDQSYVYKRDFSEVPSPMDEEEFTFESFAKSLSEMEVALKTVLVGKDAVVVGLGNSAFQDIIYRAKVHPKRKSSGLTEEEKRALYDAVKSVINERIRCGGKDTFQDIHSKQGRYTPSMGPNMKGKPCPVCGTAIVKLSIGGGQTYLCPKCQQ